MGRAVVETWRCNLPESSAQYAACRAANAKPSVLAQVGFAAVKTPAARRRRRARDGELAAQVALLRDVFDPSRSASAPGPAWLTWGGGTVP